MGGVLIVTMEYPPLALGGAATVPMDEAVGLAAAGVDVHVMFDDHITMRVHRRPCGQVRLNRTRENERLTLHPIASCWPWGLNMYLGYACGWNPPASRCLRDLIREVDPDVIHLHNYSLLGDQVLEIATQAGKPVFVSMHDFWFVCPAMTYLQPSGLPCDHPRNRSKYNCFVCCMKQKKIPLSRLFAGSKRYSRAVSAFIVSNRYLESLLKTRGYPETKIHAVPYALSMADFSDTHAQDAGRELRARLGLTDKRIVLYTGKLHVMKGLEILIGAFRALHQQNRDCVLVLVGDGPHRDRLRRLTSDLADILWLDILPREDLIRVYQLCDMLVVPSLYPEFFSISAHEAMLCGKPVIASNYGALPEFIVHGENGLLFDVGDAGGLVDSIAYLLLHDSVRAEMGARARVIASRFTLDRHIDSLLRVFRDAAGVNL